MSDASHSIKRLVKQNKPDKNYECINDDCKADSWFVKEIKAGHWQMGYQEGQYSFQIAATQAICPLCATTLLIQKRL